jgi:hypothetical protein
VEFWPRDVDVARGWGRHCHSNCSSKAHQKPKVYQATCQGCGETFEAKSDGARWHKECRRKYQIEQAGKVVCDGCGRSKASDAECSYCAWFADKERREKVARGESTKMTTEQFAALRGCGGATVRNATATVLAEAWDGRYIDISHPAAVAYAAKPVREKRGRVDIACAQCGKQKSIFASLASRKQELFFCDRKCSAAYHAERAPRYDIAGVGFTMRELTEACGANEHFIGRRIRAGMSAAEAVVDQKDRPKKRKTPTE